MENVKNIVEVEKIEEVEVLSEKVKKYPYEAKNLFDDVQDDFNDNDYLCNVDVWNAYNERNPEGKKFIGTYEIVIKSTHKYWEFLDVLRKDVASIFEIYNREQYVLQREIWRDAIPSDSERYREIHARIDEIQEEKENHKLFELYKHEDCLDDMLSFEEWETGKTKKGTRLGKHLRKLGVSNEVLDYYSQQIKDSGTVFLTISDRVQDIANMSAYADYNWNGHNGTSCQDHRHNENYNVNLVGALHDDELFIAMLHMDRDDAYDMQDRLEARCLMRLVEIDGTYCLLPLQYYGNNTTKDMLNEALKELEQVEEIYSYRVRRGREHIEREANGAYELETVRYEYIYIDDEYEVNYDCPVCDGSGRMDTEYTEIDCLHCGGDGTIQDYMWIEIEDEVEVVHEESVTMYADDFGHYGYKIRISLDSELIEEIRECRLV